MACSIYIQWITLPSRSATSSGSASGQYPISFSNTCFCTCYDGSERYSFVGMGSPNTDVSNFNVDIWATRGTSTAYTIPYIRVFAIGY